jgi:hypothetical protein
MDATLDDIGEQYRQMLGGTLSDGNLSQESTKKADKNMRWTRVVTRQQLSISGLGEFKLEEDLDEAWEEINSAAPDTRNSWQPLFNPKDLEHADYSKDPEDYRLSAEELEELGKQVVRLRQHVQLRANAIRTVGDAVEVQALPPQISQEAIDAERQRLHRRILANEEDRNEPSERGLSHKYRRRKLHELSAEDIVAIGHAKLVDERARRDIAEEYRVSIGLVSRVATKCKEGLEFVEEKQSSVRKKTDQVAAVTNAVSMILS